MIHMIYLLTASILILGFILYRKFTAYKTRQRLLALPLTDAERAIIAKQVPLYNKVPVEYHSNLEGKINLFLDQVEFIGCDGLEISEDMGLSIAAQACIMVANTNMWYDSLQTILIYPGAFKSRQKSANGHIVTERTITRIGESWVRGPVVLSWAHSKTGAFTDDDGHNVVLHEFTHQLDALSGYTDAVPVLKSGHTIKEWQNTFQSAFARHKQDIKRNLKTKIDAYGATLPEEYFAVVVELFFERPTDLKNEEPKVYEQLVQFFEMNPEDWAE